jgi:hypothetical protein
LDHEYGISKEQELQRLDIHYFGGERMAGYEKLFVQTGKLASQMPQCITTTALEDDHLWLGLIRKGTTVGAKETGMKHNNPFLSPSTNHRIQPLDISDTRMSISKARHGPA